MRNGAISSLRLAELSDFISGTQNSNLEINEGEMRKIIIVGLILLPAALFAQAPAPAAPAPRRPPLNYHPREPAEQRLWCSKRLAVTTAKANRLRTDSG